jgi:hypothetical protein
MATQKKRAGGRKSTKERLAELDAMFRSGAFEEARKQREAAEAEAPKLVAALNAAGFEWTKSLDPLLAGVNELRGDQYRIVASVFLQHLEAGLPPLLANSLLQSLAATKPRSRARPHWAQISSLFLSAASSEVRDGAAVALAAIAEPADGEVVLSWLRDPRFGESRIFFLRALRRLLPPAERAEVLETLKRDPDLEVECDRVLRGIAPNDG